MIASNVIISNETQDKVNRQLNKRKRGQLHFGKLKEAEREGRLAFAKNRIDVALLAGYDETDKYLGYSWVSNMIKRGHLVERITNQIDVREYYIANEPEYSMAKASASRWKKPQKETSSEIAAVPIVKIEKTRGDTIIKIEVPLCEETEKLVQKILE